MDVISSHLKQSALYKGFVLFVFLLIALPSSAQDGRETEEYKQGAGIFMSNCASCHKVQEELIGPALKGVYDKYDKEWLYSWIKNSQAMVKSGDPQAVKVWEDYNKQVMNAFALSNEEIDNVLTYIQVETDSPPVVAEGEDGDEANAAGFTPQMIFLAVVLLVLLAIIFFLSRILGTLTDLVREKDGLPKLPALSFGQKLAANKPLLAVGGLLLFVLMGYTTYDQASALGRQANYSPEQPIKFSHKLHAGKHQIDCQYCHSGASKGKSAVIPSVNVCMNCHEAIKKGPKYGEAEIGKIYEHWENEVPIEWVRIHNLPDHVYFSHAQHVNAGKIECQQCHGPIEEMEVVKQQEDLSMGWCIDCHRETNVQFVNNDYYQTYEHLHKDLKDGKIQSVKVEDIRGLECQKCHY